MLMTRHCLWPVIGPFTLSQALKWGAWESAYFATGLAWPELIDHMKCLYERQVDCSHTMYPAFALMGSGGIQLEEPITAKYLEYQKDM